MELCLHLSDFISRPAGRWIATRSGLFWCHSPTLCGLAVWGRPGADTARELLQIMDGYRQLAPRFDILTDAAAVEGIEVEALTLLLEWLRRNLVILEHVRTRVAVIPPGISGLALAGIAPALALDSPVTITTDVRTAFRTLPDGGDALCDEVAGLIAGARGVPALVVTLRRVLAEAHGALDLAAAARALGLSARSLQRQLAAASVSFRAEQADARFSAAEQLLQRDDKLTTVAARLGLSEDGLAQLVRTRTGLTPGELRRRLRGS